MTLTFIACYTKTARHPINVLTKYIHRCQLRDISASTQQQCAFRSQFYDTAVAYAPSDLSYSEIRCDYRNKGKYGRMYEKHTNKRMTFIADSLPFTIRINEDSEGMLQHRHKNTPDNSYLLERLKYQPVTAGLQRSYRAIRKRLIGNSSNK